MDNITPYVGYVAGAMTVVSYAPQALRAWRTKEVKDLSWARLTLLTAVATAIAWGVADARHPHERRDDRAHGGDPRRQDPLPLASAPLASSRELAARGVGNRRAAA